MNYDQDIWAPIDEFLPEEAGFLESRKHIVCEIDGCDGSSNDIKLIILKNMRSSWTYIPLCFACYISDRFQQYIIANSSSEANIVEGQQDTPCELCGEVEREMHTYYLFGDSVSWTFCPQCSGPNCCYQRAHQSIHYIDDTLLSPPNSISPILSFMPVRDRKVDPEIRNLITPELVREWVALLPRISYAPLKTHLGSMRQWCLIKSVEGHGAHKYGLAVDTSAATSGRFASVIECEGVITIFILEEGSLLSYGPLVDYVTA